MSVQSNTSQVDEALRLLKKINRNNITQGLSHQARVFYLRAKAPFEIFAKRFKTEKNDICIIGTEREIMLTVSLGVIALNEEKYIGNLLQDIINQNYPHKQMEIILVDGKSKDGTKQIMNQFRKDNKKNFMDIKVLDNPKKTQPCGWNVALEAYCCDVFIKVDAHGSIPYDFVSKCVAALNEGEDIVGGQRPCILDNSAPFSETLLLAENSMFGSSIAPYRHNSGKTYVKSMFHAAYKREVFDKVGKYNENLVRTEDNEIHYRMRQAGYKFAFYPDIISYQHVRNRLGKMLKQKFSNGYWIGLTSGVCPKCLSIYHFVPCAFVTAIIASITGLFITSKAKLSKVKNIIGKLTKLMWGLYVGLAFVMSASSIYQAKEKRNATNLLLPIIFFLLHFSYGIGTIIGFIKMPKWVKGLDKIKNGRN